MALKLYKLLLWYKAVFRIRTRIDFGRLDPDPDLQWESGSGSGSRRAKNNLKLT